MKTNLTVNWTMQNPPTSAKAWHSWASFNPNLTGHNESIFFDSATREALDLALSQKLDRFTGWEALGAPERGPLAKAASVFKRGVPFKSCDTESEAVPLSGSYPIEIAPAHIHPVEALKEAFLTKNLFVVIDRNIPEHWNLSPFKADFHLEANEKNKNVDTVEHICKAAKKARSPDHWLIIGGGITADTAAFAANIMKKSFTLVPTTLLAMADACVGGKTGVNAHPFGKNLIGSFAFPEKVLVIPQFLKSLSTRVLRSGGAECLKHAFLAGKPEKAAKIADALKEVNLLSLSEELEFIIELKAKVVAEDPTEKGKRATLNLGHTLAHALEAISHKHNPPDQHIHHGEAVAVGLAFCFLISKKVVPNSVSSMDTMIGCLINSGLMPTKSRLQEHLGLSLDDEQTWPQVSHYLLNDKKKSDHHQDACNWILLEEWGKIFSDKPDGFLVRLPLSKIREVWDQFVREYPL
ncbi:MAG: 3-dehydroquinate synthase [Oligoflexales bacterium]|nr:3-dehydroquinate synthase [Oligoflexales bacterium]